jgi:RHS repeat-associated protein
MEDVWLADVSTNGAFRVTQHFFDALGRETNTVVYAGTTPGEAQSPATVSHSPLSIVHSSYPHPGNDCVERTDERGAVTRTIRTILNNAEETVESVRTNGVEVLRTVNRTFLGGGSLLRREWGAGNWTEERRFDDYAPDGKRISYVVATASDAPAVTNSVSTYDLLGRLVSLSRPGANASVITTSYAYDGATNRKVSETTTGSPVVSYEYDALGDPAATIQDGRSVRSATDYTAIDGEVFRVASSIRMTGNVTNSVQVQKQQLTGLSDVLRSRAVTLTASGHETVEETSFDAGTGLLTTVAQSDSATPVTSVSRCGLALAQTTLDGRQEFAYDAFGRRTVASLVDTATGVTNRMDFMAYDSSGNVVRRTTDFGADGIGVWEYSYDVLGRENSRTDALGHIQTTAHDPLDRVIAVGGDTYPLAMDYDTTGRKTSGATTRDGGETWDGTQWEYDIATGLNTAKEYADGSRVAYAYTDNGRRTRTTWARGAWREHAYNDRNLVSATTYSGAVTPSVAYTYTNSGKVASATLSDGTAYAYAYDDRLLATNETVAIGQDDYALERTYDAFRRPLETAVVVTNVRHAAKTRLYDSENRIVGYALTNAAGRGVSVLFAYDGSYLTNSLYTLPNGGHLNVCLTRNPSRKELVTRRETTFGGLPTYWYEANYDILGRPTNATDSVSLAREWQYNSRSELAEATIGTNAYGYAYDTIGNRERTALNGVTNTYAANSLNQYTTIPRPSGPPRSPLYDADGNLVNDRTMTYVYDAENRLISATSASMTNGAIRVVSAYDHRHRRIRKIVQHLTVTMPPAPSPPSETYEWNTVETHTFVWDGDDIVLERITFTNGTSPVCEYFWGPDMSGAEQGAGGVGGLLAVSMDSVFYIPCYDHNGNIVRYVSESGAIAAEYVYDPYGNVVEATGPLAEQFSFGFSTQVHDRGTGLVSYQRRFFRPVFGRWLNRDQIEEDGGDNLYVFCRNAPVFSYDPNGEQAVSVSYPNPSSKNGYMPAFFIADGWCIRKRNRPVNDAVANLLTMGLWGGAESIPLSLLPGSAQKVGCHGGTLLFRIFPKIGYPSEISKLRDFSISDPLNGSIAGAASNFPLDPDSSDGVFDWYGQGRVTGYELTYINKYPIYQYDNAQFNLGYEYEHSSVVGGRTVSEGFSREPPFTKWKAM